MARIKIPYMPLRMFMEESRIMCTRKENLMSRLELIWNSNLPTAPQAICVMFVVDGRCPLLRTTATNQAVIIELEPVIVAV